MRNFMRVVRGSSLSIPSERMRTTSGHLGVNLHMSSTICSCSQLRCSCKTDVSSAGRGLGVHSDSGFSWLMLHLRIFEPVDRQTFSQRHAGAMKHHPEITVRNGEHRADFLTLDFVHFAHHKDGSHALRQFA